MSSNNRPVIILGAGGHAKVIAEALRKSDREIIGLLTPDTPADTEACGSVVLGDESVLEGYSSNAIELANGIGAIPGNEARWKQAARMREMGYRFAQVIHPSAVIADDVLIEDGVQIMAGVVIQPGVVIGRDSIINTGVLLDHDCVIGEDCHIAPGVVSSGGVRVGNNTHLGTGAVIIQGISIGQGSVVAAGSIVYRDVPDGTTVIQKRQSANESREN
jgi:UDP-perosamine 4-acetyltransferase